MPDTGTGHSRIGVVSTTRLKSESNRTVNPPYVCPRSLFFPKYELTVSGFVTGKKPTHRITWSCFLALPSLGEGSKYVPRSVVVHSGSTDPRTPIPPNPGQGTTWDKSENESGDPSDGVYLLDVDPVCPRHGEVVSDRWVRVEVRVTSRVIGGFIRGPGS